METALTQRSKLPREFLDCLLLHRLLTYTLIFLILTSSIRVRGKDFFTGNDMAYNEIFESHKVFLFQRLIINQDVFFY